MTIIGCKKDPNEKRKPMKRSYIKRKAPMKRSKQPFAGRSSSPGHNERAQKDEAFMEQFRGKPCGMTGRTKSKFLRGSNGKLLATAGHHLLPKSVFPEYRYDPENIFVLTPEQHSWAEDNPKEFMHWLHDNEFLRWQWVQDHRNHRRKD